MHTAHTSLLLVDDEEGIRTVLSLLLTDMGYTVRTAADGAEALALFRAAPCPFVLTDVRMPVMDGLELLRRLKAEAPGTEVLMLTGHGDMDLAVESLRAGAGDFLGKPVSDTALEVALERARGRIALREELRRYTEDLEKLVASRTRELVQTERLAAIGETAASLAHSIKNIAGALEGTMYVIEKGLSLDKREYVEEGWRMIRHDVARVRGLAVNLLDLGKQRTVRPAPADPEQPLREVAELLAIRAAEAGVRLELACEAGPEPFLMDAELAHHCLLNLALNALEACAPAGASPAPTSTPLSAGPLPFKNTTPPAPTGKATPVVHLRCARNRLPSGAQEIVYTISDNGSGLPEHMAEEKVLPFATTKEQGSGIGLFATRKSVHEMGAELSFTRRKTGGTEVRLTMNNSAFSQKKRDTP